MVSTTIPGNDATDSHFVQFSLTTKNFLSFPLICSHFLQIPCEIRPPTRTRIGPFVQQTDEICAANGRIRSEFVTVSTPRIFATRCTTLLNINKPQQTPSEENDRPQNHPPKGRTRLHPRAGRRSDDLPSSQASRHLRTHRPPQTRIGRLPPSRTTSTIGTDRTSQRRPRQRHQRSIRHDLATGALDRPARRPGSRSCRWRIMRPTPTRFHRVFIRPPRGSPLFRPGAVCYSGIAQRGLRITI